MIEEQFYKLPHREEKKRKQTDAEQQAAKSNESALYALGFRPIGAEW